MRRLLRNPALLVTVAIALILILEALYLPGGNVDIETPGFLQHYVTPRPILPAVFDPFRNDWELYQARELSYFFDWIDARLIWFGIKHGIIQFYSIVAWCMLVATVALQQYGLRTLFPRLKSRVATLLSLWFVLLPCSTNINFFRSAKYGCTLLFTATMVFSWGILVRRVGRARYQRIVIIAVLLAIAGLFDRQGAFFVAAFAGGTGALLLALQILQLHPKLNLGIATCELKVLRMLALGGLGATVFNLCYNFWLGPWIIYFLNGYFPSFAYQNLHGISLLQVLPGGVKFLCGNCGFALTGVPNATAGFLLLVLIAGGFFFCWCRTRRGRSLIAGTIFLLALVAIILASTAMVGRHPPVLHPMVMVGLYFLPIWSLLIMFAGGAADALRQGGIRFPIIETLASIGIVIHLLMMVQPQVFPYGTLQRPELSREVIELRRALKDQSYDYSEKLMFPRTERLIEFHRTTIKGKRAVPKSKKAP